MRSSVEVYELSTGSRRVVLQSDMLLEAPNWMPDGSALIVNGEGRLYRIDLHEKEEGREPDGLPDLDPVNTEFAVKLNNDHGISPCGRELLISDKTESGRSQIYRLPIDGGTPVRITSREPSYWHGISPDGATLTYCGIRGDVFDIYTIPRDGGEERCLTDGTAKVDGPDFSACGRFIYFNSEKSGYMQIWRMGADGSHPQQLTFDERVNWFPHPSPCGDWVVYLSYEPGTIDHPRDRNVELRLINPEGGKRRTLFGLFGGQGTINVPSWSPDGSAFAYVAFAPEV